MNRSGMHYVLLPLRRWNWWLSIGALGLIVLPFAILLILFAASRRLLIIELQRPSPDAAVVGACSRSVGFLAQVDLLEPENDVDPTLEAVSRRYVGWPVACVVLINKYHDGGALGPKARPFAEMLSPLQQPERVAARATGGLVDWFVCCCLLWCAALSIRLLRWRVMCRRRSTGRCEACGYPTAGLGTQTCPECGCRQV